MAQQARTQTTQPTPTRDTEPGSPGRSAGEGNAARTALLLGKGDAGRKVTRVQDQLVELDLLSEVDRAGAAGRFDGPTKRAVKDFQATRGLPATGLVDDALIRMLDDALVAQTVAVGVPAPVGRDAEAPAVERLQGLLVSAGLYQAKAFAKQRGEYTGRVAAAVRALQRQAGLQPETGEVDAATWRALGDVVGMDALWGAEEGGLRVTGQPALGPGQDLPLVAELERLLVSYGADLQPDTIFDKDTRAAVRAFQEANGLTPDGRVSPATASALSSGAARPLGGRTDALKSGDDIRSLTYDEAAALVLENGGDLYEEGEVSIIAFRTANTKTSNWDDYFVVLRKPDKIRVFEGVTRPGTFQKIDKNGDGRIDDDNDQNPSMVAAGSYDLRRYTGSNFSEAFNVVNDDNANAASVHEDRDKSLDLSEAELQQTRLDGTIKLHEGQYSRPSSWGCLNVEQWDEFWAFIDGDNQEQIIDLTIVDISKSFKGGGA